MDKIKVCCTVNGKKMQFEAHPMERLLDVLRQSAHLTGTKEGCSEGECGACSVIVNGEVVNSCLIPIAQMQDAKITTVEGLAGNKEMSRIQKSFWENGGAQCGFCTPGMLIAASDLIKKNKRPNELQIRQAISGNLCRCTGYTKIVESIVKACK